MAARKKARRIETIAPRAINTGITSNERERWLAERFTGWTASEIPALLGFDKRKSPLAVYASKMGRATDIHTEDDLELMRWGNRFEKPILDEYAERTGHEVEQVGVLLRSKEFPFILATLDGADWTAKQALEVKTFGWWASDDWESTKTGDVPKYVFVQVQMQLVVTGLAMIPVLALPLNERKLKVFEVKAHAEFQHYAIDELGIHWQRFQAGQLPEPDGHETTREALDALYSKSNGLVVELPGEWGELTDHYQSLSKQEREAKAGKQVILNKLRAELGDAGYGHVGDGRRWSLLDAAGPSHTCSACGHVDRGKGSRRPRLSGDKDE